MYSCNPLSEIECDSISSAPGMKYESFTQETNRKLSLMNVDHDASFLCMPERVESKSGSQPFHVSTLGQRFTSCKKRDSIRYWCGGTLYLSLEVPNHYTFRYIRYADTCF